MLTAQEALDQEGYIIFASDRELACGDPVRVACHDSAVPYGSEIVVLSKISHDDAESYCARVGWGVMKLYDPRTIAIYKAVAE